jgi:hypothetical protein
VLRRQPPEVREQLVDEYYKGRFRLRLVLPGRTGAADAEQVDSAGYPVWQRRVLDVYRRGMTAKASSKQTCEGDNVRRPGPDESPPAPTVALTEGSRPTIDDVLRVLGALGDLATLDLEANVDKATSVRVAYRLDSRVAEPLQNLLLLTWGLTPTLALDWDVRSERNKDDFTLLTLETKKPLRLDKTGSPVFFAGPDGDKTTFRLRLPALNSAANLTPEAAGPVIVRVKVKMPADVRQSNATLVEKNEAHWLLTARDLQQPLVLEAFCPR